MVQYQVLRPIEYNGKLYLPESALPPAPLLTKEGDKGWLVKSSGNGQDIAVDRSGTIDLPTAIAATLNLGQILAIPAEKTKGKK